MQEIITRRTENGKTYDKGNGVFAKIISQGCFHYKDNYSDDSESWKDIDLTIVDGKVTKAPYELTIDGNKVTIRCKRTGRVSVVTMAKIGNHVVGKSDFKIKDGKKGKVDIDTDIDYELVLGNDRISFQRTLKTASASKEAVFNITGDIPVAYRAFDADGFPVELETTFVDGVLAEKVKDKKGLKYPIKVDPTFDIKVAASTDDVSVFYTSTWNNYLVTDPYVFAGKQGSGWSKAGSGMRFVSVGIPAGATIVTSHITFNCYIGSTDVVTSRIVGQLAQAPVTFANLADYQARRGTDVGGANNDNRTVASVDWPNATGWTTSSNYNTPEIKTVVQEICDLGAVTNIVLFWDDHEGRTGGTGNQCHWARSVNNSATLCPRLYVEYTVAAGGGALVGGSALVGGQILCGNSPLIN